MCKTLLQTSYSICHCAIESPLQSSDVHILRKLTVEKKFRRPRFCWYFQKFVTSSLYFDLIVVVAEKLRNCNFQWPGFVCPCSVYQEFATLNSSLHFGQVFLLGVVTD